MKSLNLKTNRNPMTNLLRNKGGVHLRNLILLLLAVCTMTACDKQTVYHAFRSIPIEGWQRQDTICFDVNVPDSQTYYKLSVEVRNRNDYPYQNLQLSVSHQSHTDTLQLTLADKQGIWKGEGWGGLYQTRILVGSTRIDRPGQHQFKIAYTFPDKTLQGINDVGIRLERMP